MACLAPQSKRISVSDSDDEIDPPNQISQEQLDINMALSNSLDVRKVASSKMHSDLANEENEDITDANNKSTPILEGTCLFKDIVNDAAICSGGHDKMAEAARCVATALKYNPIYCWFCHKAGNENVGFASKGDLVEHQEDDHDEDMKRHDNCFVWIEKQDKVINQYIRSYLSIRSRPEMMTSDKFYRSMGKQIKNGSNVKMIKRKLFTSQFGYAPLSCMLCEESTKRTKKLHFFHVALFEPASRAACIQHLKRFHRQSYSRHPVLTYWFRETNKIPQMEQIFASLLALGMSQPPSDGDNCDADGSENSFDGQQALTVEGDESANDEPSEAGTTDANKSDDGDQGSGSEDDDDSDDNFDISNIDPKELLGEFIERVTPGQSAADSGSEASDEPSPKVNGQPPTLTLNRSDAADLSPIQSRLSELETDIQTLDQDIASSVSSKASSTTGGGVVRKKTFDGNNRPGPKCSKTQNSGKFVKGKILPPTHICGHCKLPIRKAQAADHFMAHHEGKPFLLNPIPKK